ncbi:MAG: hypothetical protein KDD69_07070 [Bdellovibrionales bacterium]|nr:hypothetical protein [Bdellovibrionales bacterium]
MRQNILFLLVFVTGCTSEHVELGAGPRSRAAGQSTANQTTAEATASGTGTNTAPQPEALSAECAQLVTTPPRGLACLHCTQPEARNSARQIADVLSDSCLASPAINYLVDGTFGFDETFLTDQITQLTEGGRQLFVTFYLANGPAQRQYDITVVEGFGARIDPEEFRYRIQHDPALQGRYQSLVDRIVPVVRYALQRGAAVSLIPMLEDNLSDEAFRAMAELLLAVIPPDLTVAVGRNPCPGCYSGNDHGIPPGFFEELHTDWAGVGISNGIVTNDGRHYHSAAAPSTNAETTLDELRAVRDAAGRNNNTFILWSAARQGLPESNGAHPLPSQRYYAPLAAAERSELIRFLRE